MIKQSRHHACDQWLSLSGQCTSLADCVVRSDVMKLINQNNNFDLFSNQADTGFRLTKVSARPGTFGAAVRLDLNQIYFKYCESCMFFDYSFSLP